MVRRWRARELQEALTARRGDLEAEPGHSEFPEPGKTALRQQENRALRADTDELQIRLEEQNGSGGSRRSSGRTLGRRLVDELKSQRRLSATNRCAADPARQ